MLTPVTTVTSVTPNAVIIPQILINTIIRSGTLVSSAQILLQPAYVDNDGKWQATGQAKNIHIPDINNLPEDLASLASDMSSAETALLGVINSVNGIRHLV